MVLDLAIPVPSRAKKNTTTLRARPDSSEKSPKARLAAPMTGPLRNRSASQPMGNAPRNTNDTEAAPKKTMTPSPTPKLSRISGARTASAAASSSSRLLSINKTTKVAMPPLASPSRSDISWLPTPGSTSSGNKISSSASALSVWLSSTRRDRAPASSRAASVICPPFRRCG